MVLLQGFITFILKPNNVMLDSSFKARLGDFGLARTVEHEKSHATEYIAGTFGFRVLFMR